MKTTKLLPYMLIALLTVSCQDEVDIAAEKAAIIEVINEETEAFLDYNMEKVKSYYVQDSLNFRLTTGADDHVFLEGWDEVEAFLRSEMEVDDAPERAADTHIRVEKDQYRIKVYDRSAYVICMETWTYKTPGGPVEIKSRQVRFMEKIDEEWKIAFLSFIGISGYENLESSDDEIMN